MLLGSFSEKKKCIVFKGKKLFFFSKTTMSYNKFKFHFIHVFSENIFKILCGIHDLQKSKNKKNKNFLNDIV